MSSLYLISALLVPPLYTTGQVPDARLTSQTRFDEAEGPEIDRDLESLRFSRLYDSTPTRAKIMPTMLSTLSVLLNSTVPTKMMARRRAMSATEKVSGSTGGVNVGAESVERDPYFGADANINTPLPALPTVSRKHKIQAVLNLVGEGCGQNEQYL